MNKKSNYPLQLNMQVLDADGKEVSILTQDNVNAQIALSAFPFCFDGYKIVLSFVKPSIPTCHE